MATRAERAGWRQRSDAAAAQYVQDKLNARDADAPELTEKELQALKDEAYRKQAI